MNEWNVLFFLRGWPVHRRFGDAHYFVANVDEPMRRQFADDLRREFSRVFPSRSRLVAFFESEPVENLCVAGFRVTAVEHTEALGIAHDYLTGILSGLSLLPDVHPVQASPICLCHRSVEPDAEIIIRSSGQWAELRPRRREESATWRQRSDALFSALLTYFDVASGKHPRRETALGARIQNAARLANAGERANHFGLEFIAKFAAMEALVCGGENWKKQDKLKARIPWLFREDVGINATLVGELWTARNAAVHEANAQFSELITGSNALQCHIDHVEHLLAGAMVFTLAHVGSYDSGEALWKDALDNRLDYRLPVDLLVRRSAAIARFPISQMVVRTRMVVKNASTMFDRCLNSPAS